MQKDSIQGLGGRLWARILVWKNNKKSKILPVELSHASLVHLLEHFTTTRVYKVNKVVSNELSWSMDVNNQLLTINNNCKNLILTKYISIAYFISYHIYEFKSVGEPI